MCSGGSTGTGCVDCVLEDVSNPIFFLLPNVRRGYVCIRGSSGTGGVDCVLEDVYNTTLFSLA